MAIPVLGRASGHIVVDSILDGGNRWLGSDTIGVTINTDGGPPSLGLRRTEPWEQKALAAGLSEWERVADIRFRPVADKTDANIRIATAPERAFGVDGLLGFQEGPYSARTTGFGQAFGAYVTDGYGWGEAGVRPGGYGFLTILHELGHGLGLAHPFDEGASGQSPALFGVDDISTLGSVMAYADWDLDRDGYAAFDARNEGSPSRHFGQFLTPNPLDIAAVQHLYGANTKRAVGDGGDVADDVYWLPSANAPGTGWRTIWDTGGTDWIRHDGARDCRISLVPFVFEDDWVAFGGLSQARGVRGGVMIADDFTEALAGRQAGFRGVLIENAAGGRGDDRIVGNSEANRLLGKVGDDHLKGGGGDDRLSGGAGADRLNGGRGADVIIGGAGADVFVFATGCGVDTIRDFDGSDRIDLSRHGEATGFRQLIIAASDAGDSVLIDLGGDALRLAGVAVEALGRDDFLF